jgi:hypothetical protein
MYEFVFVIVSTQIKNRCAKISVLLTVLVFYHEAWLTLKIFVKIPFLKIWVG